MRKIGDTVKITVNPERYRAYPYLAAEMRKYTGMETTIRSIDRRSFGPPEYRLDIDGGRFLWPADQIEAVEVEEPAEVTDINVANIHEAEYGSEDAYEIAVRDQIEHCWRLLFSKRKEYATADPFHNFRRAADLQGITKEQALIGMMDKHVISVHDMVNEAAEGADFSADKWQEKIGDNINYLLILWAMVALEGGA